MNKSAYLVRHSTSRSILPIRPCSTFHANLNTFYHFLLCSEEARWSNTVIHTTLHQYTNIQSLLLHVSLSLSICTQNINTLLLLEDTQFSFNQYVTAPHKLASTILLVRCIPPKYSSTRLICHSFTAPLL